MRGQSHQEIKFNQQIDAITKGAGEDEFEIAGEKLNSRSQFYFFMLILGLLGGLIAMLSGKPLFTIPFAIFAVLMGAMLMKVRKQELEQQVQIRETQLEQFRKQKPEDDGMEAQ